MPRGRAEVRGVDSCMNRLLYCRARCCYATALLLALGFSGSPAWADSDTTAAPPEQEPAAAGDDATASELRIIIEAEVPEGFPAPGPAGEVTLKRYPAYRAARADGRGSFRVLFNHIQRNDIAMTTPVEMTLDANDEGKAVPRANDMAFLYVDPELGEAGSDPADSRVDVLDLPARSYLSYGFFGESDAVTIAKALEKINATLDGDDSLVADGPARLMGYNSPFVPAPLRYHEVQQPVTQQANPETAG